MTTTPQSRPMTTFGPDAQPGPQAAGFPNDCLVLRDGHFDGMAASDFHAYMQTYAALADQRPIVVHFHGGLDSQADGLGIAASLRKPYAAAGGFPVFFVWESGLLEIIGQNLPQMLAEPVAKKLFGYLMDAVGRKLGVPIPTIAVASLPGADDGIQSKMPQADTIQTALYSADALPVVTEAERAQLVDQVNQDPVIRELVAQVASETSVAVSALSPEQARALPRASAYTMMKPEVVAEMRQGPTGVTAAGLPILGIALRAGKLLVKIWQRIQAKRDHGLYVTIVEGLLDEFFVGDAAKTVWTDMKNATEHAFGADADCGGTAFLNELCALVGAGRAPKKVVLVGHSTGAVYICNLLKHADAALRAVESAGHPAFQFDVAFLAPACTFKLFDDTLQDFQHRIRSLRLFAMKDELEQQDKIAGQLYPRSLLYFVSGVCETDPMDDAPILGMQRFHSGAPPFDATHFPDIARVREFLSPPDRTVWSKTDDQAPAGERSQSEHHGGFSTDPQTVESLQAIIAAPPPVATADVPLVIFPARIAGKSRREAARNYTGRYLVMFKDGAGEHGRRLLANKAGVAAAAFSPRAERPDMSVGASVVFPRFDVGVMAMDPDQRRAAGIHAAAGGPIEIIVPERIVYTATISAAVLPPLKPRRAESRTASEAVQVSDDYLAGLGDGSQAIIDVLRRRSGGQAGPAPSAPGQPGTRPAPAPASPAAPAAVRQWDPASTWAIQAIAANRSKYSGQGIRIAVLDTGFWSGHPHFTGRSVVMESFVPSASAEDGNGHGTHCIGLACGPLSPGGGVPRYGVAYGADIYAGKVLSDAGTGSDMNITAGIDWALERECHIVSMSFAAAVGPSDPYNAYYERIASRALAAGTIIMAAAGNDSRRPIYLAPISHPANCPSIKAVGAVDEDDAVGFFSNAGINPKDGGVGVVAPGVHVLSAWNASPPTVQEENGTSMATPLAAGIVALWAEKTTLRGNDLWNAVTSKVLGLTAPASDVGVGLVQAPLD